MFIRRKEDEERLKQIAHQTVEKYRNADSVDYEEQPIPHLDPCQTNEDSFPGTYYYSIGFHHTNR